MFTGEYRHTVDDKGRIAVPAEFRAQLERRRGRLALARRLPGDPHPGRLGRARRRRSRRCPSPIQHARRFQRFIFAGAVEVELDRQGRVLVPAYLREPVGLGSEAVVVGVARPRRDLGARPLGRPTAGDSTTRRRSPRPSSGLGI